VFVVMKGAGRSTVGDRSFDWEFGDTIAAPGWYPVQHHVTEDSVLFSMSDEALMRWTRFYRFEDVERR
jgi:gentisate 1,2-dioxygenase